MKKLLFVIFFVFSLASAADSTLVGQIRRNNPNLKTSYILKIVQSLKKWSAKTGVEARLMAAIFMQESAYKLSAKGCHKHGCDWGISQIYDKTIDTFGFDKDRLITDLDYSIGAGFTVMQEIMVRRQRKEAYWWTRYNSSTPSKRLRYRKLVLRWY